MSGGKIRGYRPMIHRAKDSIPSQRTVSSAWEADWDRRRGRTKVFGLTWREMPGTDDTLKKMNFFLFSRGKMETDDLGQVYRRTLNTNQRRHRERLRRAVEAAEAAEVAL